MADPVADANTALSLTSPPRDCDEALMAWTTTRTRYGHTAIRFTDQTCLIVCQTDRSIDVS